MISLEVRLEDDRMVYAEYRGSLWYLHVEHATDVAPIKFARLIKGWIAKSSQFVMLLEDTIVTMPRRGEGLVCYDVVTATIFRSPHLSIEQLYAIVMIALFGEEDMLVDIDELYALAAPVFENCPRECRPIP